MKIKLCRKVSGNRLDNMSHSEWPGVKHGKDDIPLPLKMSPGKKSASWVGGNRAQDWVEVLPSYQVLVKGHVQVSRRNWFWNFSNWYSYWFGLPLKCENVLWVSKSLQQLPPVWGNVGCFILIITPLPFILSPSLDTHRVHKLLQVCWDMSVVVNQLSELIFCFSNSILVVASNCCSQYSLS